VPPEQIVYASDYPYGQQPAMLLLTLRIAKAAGLDDDRLRDVLAGNANRIADGERPLEPSQPRGGELFTQPMALARVHQYLSMAITLLFTRQPDSFGALGLALNATGENGHRPEMQDIRELLVAARELWRTLPEATDDSETSTVTRTTSRLILLADILAVTTSD
jgi:hypothetical protein